MFRFIDIRSYLIRVSFTFRALRSPNYRLFFFGQLVSLMGTFMQNLALGWLVYRLTDSPFLLGAVGFVGQIPSLFLTPFAGVYADRLNRRKVLVITQSLSMVLAFVMAYLFFTEAIQIWHIMLIAVINGISLAFDTPFRHAFLVEMVDDMDLLQNAIALNSTLNNSARFIGPTLGGLVVAWLSEGYCFAINGVSFMAVIASLLVMKVTPMVRNGVKKSIFSELKDGLRYSYRFKPIRYLLLLIISTGFFGLPFQVFLPVFARDILHGNSQLLGFLTGALGAGALLGSFFLASRKGIANFPRLILMNALMFGVGLMVFSLSSWEPLSLLVIFIVGFGMITHFAATNTLLQHIVDEDKRGRVIALYGMSFMGITPLGSLLLGIVSPSVGVQLTLAVSSFVCLIAAAVFAKRIGLINSAVAKCES